MYLPESVLSAVLCTYMRVCCLLSLACLPVMYLPESVLSAVFKLSACHVPIPESVLSAVFSLSTVSCTYLRVCCLQ
jgi:hypothetical protein